MVPCSFEPGHCRSSRKEAAGTTTMPIAMSIDRPLGTASRGNMTRVTGPRRPPWALFGCPRPASSATCGFSFTNQKAPKLLSGACLAEMHMLTCPKTMSHSSGLSTNSDHDAEAVCRTCLLDSHVHVLVITMLLPENMATSASWSSCRCFRPMVRTGNSPGERPLFLSGTMKERANDPLQQCCVHPPASKIEIVTALWVARILCTSSSINQSTSAICCRSMMEF